MTCFERISFIHLLIGCHQQYQKHFSFEIGFHTNVYCVHNDFQLIWMLKYVTSSRILIVAIRFNFSVIQLYENIFVVSVQILNSTIALEYTKYSLRVETKTTAIKMQYIWQHFRTISNFVYEKCRVQKLFRHIFVSHYANGLPIQSKHIFIVSFLQNQ